MSEEGFNPEGVSEEEREVFRRAYSDLFDRLRDVTIEYLEKPNGSISVPLALTGTLLAVQMRIHDGDASAVLAAISHDINDVFVKVVYSKPPD